MFEKISEKIFALLSQANSSNCFLLRGSKRTGLVDTGVTGNSALLLDSLLGLGLRPADIRLVLHTHGHADHFGCDSLFQEAKIAMHRADAEAVNSRDTYATCAHFFSAAHFPKVTDFLSDNQQIDLGSVKLRVVHTPGHTAGSACFFAEKQAILFSGDTLFSRGIGRADLPTGNRQQLLESIQKLQNLNFGTLLPGHGPILQGKEKNRRNISAMLRLLSTKAFL